MSDLARCWCTDMDGPCPACERAAEDRADALRDVQPEPLDRWGRDADWHYPRGYGGLA